MKIQDIVEQVARSKECFIGDYLNRGYNRPYAEVQWQVQGGEENVLFHLFGLGEKLYSEPEGV